MSGIVAIVNFDGEPVDPQVLKAMAEQCAYRGPDGIHYWIQGNVGLAHLALHATQEALREVQPLLSADGMLCLTADARVDNRPELIPLLAAKGEPVTSDSTDADLILAAYCVWGQACPEQIIGDYAFAIWDAKEQRLFCARDVYGVKSLHYSRVGATLCVASEAQQIIQHPKVPRILDEVTVAYYLVDYLQDETRTMFQDVQKVPPAHILIVESSNVKLERYWDIDPNFQTIHQDDNEYAAHFLEIFQRAVADRLRTPDGTNIGITMSGGLDSTSVAAVAQRIINNQAGRPHLLACSFAFDQLKECDERIFSQPMADELGIDLIYVPAENFWLLDNEDAFTPSLESPFMATESLTRHILTIFQHREARVWLTGHGGDSVVGGNWLFYADRLQHVDLSIFREIAQLFHNFNRPFPSMMRAYRDWILKPLIPEPVKKLIRAMKKSTIPVWLDADFARRTRIAKRISDASIRRCFPDRARQENYERIISLGGVERAVNYQERLAPQFHLEGRHPFLDRRLVEYILSISPEQIRRGWQGKYILRMALSGILPEIVRTRQWKTSFQNYYQLGLIDKESGKNKTLLESPLLLSFCKRNMVKYEMINNTINNDFYSLWRIITLELWIRKFFQQVAEFDMRMQKTNPMPEEKLGSNLSMSIKTYHSPQLTEWGDLQVITRGPGTGIYDVDLSGNPDGTGSTFNGRPLGN